MGWKKVEDHFTTNGGPRGSRLELREHIIDSSMKGSRAVALTITQGRDSITLYPHDRRDLIEYFKTLDGE